MRRSDRIWRMVHEERRRLVADLSALSDEQWALPSLCPGWDLHDVVAHLVDTARTGRVSFVRDLVAARMNFDRANENGIVREKRSDARQTLVALTQVTGLTRTPPANLTTRLVEAIVHGEDIRRPLGWRGDYPPGSIAEALDHQLRTPVSFGGGRDRAEGLRLVDSSTGVSRGSGDEVVADSRDLLLAVSGRTVDRSLLSGRGVARLLERA